MLRRWLYAALAAAALVGCNPTGAAPFGPVTVPFIPDKPGAPVPAEVYSVYARWQPFGIEVTFESRRCGFENAWYEYDKQKVILCDEYFSQPALLRHVVNHELAHAFQWQAKLDRSVMNIEAEADELAFWLSTPPEVEAAIKDWMKTPKAGGNTHPLNSERARMYRCLRDGVLKKGNAVCRLYAQSSFTKWALMRAHLRPVLVITLPEP